MNDTETEPTTEPTEPDTEPTEPTEPDTEPTGRCEAETTVGGNLYRCALQENHDDEHSFVAADSGEILDGEVQASSEAEMMAANRKVAKSAQTYWESVKRNYGDDLGGFHECPLCVGYPPGLFFPSELPPEKVAALKTLLGMPSMDNYKRANAYGVCATCDGLGTVLTGSMVPAHMTHRCVDCDGKGYIAHEAKWDSPTKAPILSAPANGGETEPIEAPDFDPWGRPKGDPDYYRMPIAGVTT